MARNIDDHVDLAARKAAQQREKVARDAEEATIRDAQIIYEEERGRRIAQNQPLAANQFGNIALMPGRSLGLPRTPRKFDSIWAIMDRLMKLAHFLPVKATDTAEHYAPLYIKEIVSNSYHASIQMVSFKAFYGRRCRSPIGWFEDGEEKLLGPDLVHQVMEKVKIIKERLKTAQSHQKSYSDMRREDLEFKEDDWVFLKVSPMMGVMQFGKKGKLSPRYIRPYRIMQRVVGDPSLIVPVEAIEVNEKLIYEEIPITILDRQVQKLRNKDIASIKVLWQNQQVEEAIWYDEEEMKGKYPLIFV
nr:uncharacterized protein LOC104099853 [Nicotiana tomentosiformis]